MVAVGSIALAIAAAAAGTLWEGDVVIPDSSPPSTSAVTSGAAPEPGPLVEVPELRGDFESRGGVLAYISTQTNALRDWARIAPDEGGYAVVTFHLPQSDELVQALIERYEFAPESPISYWWISDGDVGGVFAAEAGENLKSIQEELNEMGRTEKVLGYTAMRVAAKASVLESLLKEGSVMLVDPGNIQVVRQLVARGETNFIYDTPRSPYGGYQEHVLGK